MAATPNSSGRRAAVTRELLVKTYPNCFAGKGKPKRPLAVGIFEDILNQFPEIGFKRLQEALDDYTSGPTYLKSIVDGAERVRLDGSCLGVVTAGQAQHAKHRMLRFAVKPAPALADAADLEAI